MTASSLTPEFLWAQRKDVVLLTINLPNVKKAEAKINLSDDGHVYFKAPAGNVGHEDEYTLDIALFKGIKAGESKYAITARNVRFTLTKAESGPYWDRLLKAEGRNVHCKIDWDHWRDEDDDEYSFGDSFGDNKDLQDMDFVSGDSTPDEEEEETIDATAS